MSEEQGHEQENQEQGSEQEQATDSTFFDMSDEDFANLSPEQLVPPTDNSAEDDDGDDESPEDSEDENSEDENQGEDDDATDEEDDSEQDGEVDDADDNEDDDQDADDDSESENDDQDQEDDSEDGVDYEAEYKKLTAPFTAFGREISVKDVDEAIQLMQKGADYSRKMAALKPGRKILKLLEKAELLDENKLSYLIDLNNNNPAAVRKLVKDSKIDPMELQNVDEDEQNYEAPDRSVDDAEITFDDVVDEIKQTPTYAKTINIVGTEWDTNSQKIVANQPELLRQINLQVATGVYDIVSNEVERERSFGRLDGVSDIEAYKVTGDRLEKAGAFAHLDSEQSGDKADKPGKSQSKSSTESKQDKKKRQAKRNAASSSKKSVRKQGQSQDYDPLNMSDEEFLAQADSSFS